jgi:hypothetical protein
LDDFKVLGAEELASNDVGLGDLLVQVRLALTERERERKRKRGREREVRECSEGVVREGAE